MADVNAKEADPAALRDAANAVERYQRATALVEGDRYNTAVELRVDWLYGKSLPGHGDLTAAVAAVVRSDFDAIVDRALARLRQTANERLEALGFDPLPDEGAGSAETPDA